ncbi:hypothetical protein NCU05907 [Neurospora crassa OR74A]|uniref:Uncharacterized protein n=1 Tax=Neurospora crassa (strain ATCC 24698 / 74-OR23-1A / CBS 708.71 / DSM 1257 / FGSC 987) TaxID=367110 RepID=Q7S0N3_NEUCR|nr:hypothetical protein NCU05907 [Neurospora crassa OR74A]EAA28871.1 hypothetical protein NCU05907 [Neurospora crassa OR74A]|eukprot:XP_958107.1 hypothetical protein NCU05907 [Neurospora crassa OR74A]
MPGIPTGNLAGGPAGAGLPGTAARDPGPGTDAMTGIMDDDGNRVKAAEPAHSTIKSTIKLNAFPKFDGTKWTHKFNLDEKYKRQIQTEFYETNQHQYTPAGRAELIKEDTTMETHCQASLPCYPPVLIP